MRLTSRRVDIAVRLQHHSPNDSILFLVEKVVAGLVEEGTVRGRRPTDEDAVLLASGGTSVVEPVALSRNVSMGG